MTRVRAVFPLLIGRLKFVGVLWLVSAAFLWTENQAQQREIMRAQAEMIASQQEVILQQMMDMEEAIQRRAEVELIRSRTFEDYYKYYKIIPPEPIVPYGAEAWFISDARRLITGYRIKWEEYIECDHDPYDGIERFTFYKQAVTTSIRIDELREYVPAVDRKGFPVTNISTGKPIRYITDHDMDCRLVSEMTQLHKHGETKHLTMRSRAVKVRKNA